MEYQPRWCETRSGLVLRPDDGIQLAYYFHKEGLYRRMPPLPGRSTETEFIKCSLFINACLARTAVMTYVPWAHQVGESEVVWSLYRIIRSCIRQMVLWHLGSWVDRPSHRRFAGVFLLRSFPFLGDAFSLKSAVLVVLFAHILDSIYVLLL